MQFKFKQNDVKKRNINDKNKKVSRFGVRELERILFDLFAESFANLKQQKKRHCRIEVLNGLIEIKGI